MKHSYRHCLWHMEYMHMSIKLLMLADDFSGALDTGVKFSSMGISTQVLPNKELGFRGASSEVLVINTETRHLPAAEAASIIRSIVTDAKDAGIPYIFKKTDSVLRGNIGAELSAALECSSSDMLAFFPAFPEMQRTTKNGVQYYAGTPIHESCLGDDPFDPVLCSCVADIIHRQSDTSVISVPVGGTGEKPADTKSIFVFDSETDEEMEAAVARLAAEKRLKLVAGCAGLASIIQPYLHLEQNAKTNTGCLKKPLLFVCGSVNPVTRSQIAYADRNGFRIVQLKQDQQLDPDFVTSEAFSSIAEQVHRSISQGVSTVLVSDPSLTLDTLPAELLARVGTLEQQRVQISQTLAALLKCLLDKGVDCSLMVSGGDVLLEAIRQIGCPSLEPTDEIAPGTVLSSFTYCKKTYQLVSKSGGFGAETLLVDLLQTT